MVIDAERISTERFIRAVKLESGASVRLRRIAKVLRHVAPWLTTAAVDEASGLYCSAQHSALDVFEVQLQTVCLVNNHEGFAALT